ncbi:hypothetical protein FHS27_005095 [Rhodopirellula rubra]|uniref:Uncharacterized protein n=1 Tax=Aporhodopirellula rubra TaxID=980271 RepID=A0A7W5E2Z3_9BACT|nr:hypothetical protein [Aporhodopirellula rubra]MBB3209255.1 hypothetical protein [Aporhodopirellula rubra]
MNKRATWIGLAVTMSLGFSAFATAQATKTVTFNTRDKGVPRVIKEWGIDATWVNYYNAKASLKNAGDQIDFIRIGFYLHEQTNEDGSLSDGQIEKLDGALRFVDMVDEEMPVMLSPCNMAGIIDWYKNSDGTAKVDRWFNVMLRSKQYVESKGHKVVSVEVFNEPDFRKWNMGKAADLNHLLGMCATPEVKRIGPSTLATQPASDWYQVIRANVEVGSTHTLGGNMMQYVEFINLVKQHRKQFMNPEVHALVEAIVGAELGIDSVCWWDQINKGRAAFMKANLGKRLAFVPVVENWSAACVYRSPDEVLYGFASTNERTNGKDTVYDFVCLDNDVTYCLNGNAKKGVSVKKGQPFKVQAKVEGQGKESITKWFTIIPSDKGN